MANRISDPVITRRGDVVPGDKQDQPVDGSTSTVSFSDGTSVNWWDACQHALLRMADDLGRVGPLNDRPNAGSDQPVWWLVTGEASSPYWTYNDGSSWLKADQFLDGPEWGANPGDSVVASGSVTYSAGAGRDVHVQTDLTVENTSGSSATEDVTVTLYDGTGTGGTQLLTETQSVTVSANSTTTATFIATEEQLDGGDYHIDVSFSGSTLATASDGLVEETAGATYRWDDAADGTARLRDTRQGTTILTVDPLSGTIDLQGNAINTTEGLASGEATLSSGSATVDTGVSTSTTAGYFVGVALRPESGADIAASVEDDSGGTGNWVIHLEENTTSVGNPTVGWKLTQE